MRKARASIRQNMDVSVASTWSRSNSANVSASKMWQRRDRVESDQHLCRFGVVNAGNVE